MICQSLDGDSSRYIGLETPGLVQDNISLCNCLTLSQRLVSQLGKINVVLDCVEYNINGILCIVGHCAQCLFAIF